MTRPWLASIKTHVFRGKTYRLFWRRPRFGPPPPKGKEWVGHVSSDDKLMIVYPDKDAWDFFWNMLHESQHTCFPDLDDHSIDEWETDCKRLAKRAGFRVINQDPKKSMHPWAEGDHSDPRIWPKS